MSKKALITGISGQDGSYLAELLLEKGYEVHGIIRRSSSFNTGRIDHIFPQLNLHFGDLADSSSLRKLMEFVHPDEVYHLGAQSHVRVSFDIPEYTCDIDALGTLRLLESIRDVDTNIKFYNAGSSEMFGKAKPPQSESTPFEPRSPYACAKVFSYYTTINYREAYGIHASNGILYNHESERRGETFVTRKITKAAGRIVHGLQDELRLGNLAAKRDWGYSKDYMEAIYLMLQQDQPDDYVVATGTSYSVEDFLKLVFKKAGLNWKDYVVIDPHYFRPTEVDHSEGNPSKIKAALGWEPKVDLEKMVDLMLAHDLEEAAKEKVLRDAFE